MKHPRLKPTTKGFTRAVSLMQSRIRTASEGRGFAQSRLLTHWAEIAGQDIAQQAHPVNITYARGGMGATLTLLTTGSMAPMLEMQKEQIRTKVNACYGYSAISRIRITQTAPTGLAEGRAMFDHAPKVEKSPDPETERKARDVVGSVKDGGLQDALARLGANILTKTQS